jgi:hypothetical protein
MSEFQNMDKWAAAQDFNTIRNQADEITRLRAEVEKLTRERDAAFADRDAEERERVLLSKELDVMAKRQPYDAATPFYPEKVTENGILSRLRGLGFGSMEREVSALINDRNQATARAEAAEKQVDLLAKEVAEWRSRPDALRADKAERQLAMAVEACADDIRGNGWIVAVHNDYRLDGHNFTFWLFTKNGHAVKGEGRSDAEALNIVRATITGLEKADG